MGGGVPPSRGLVSSGRLKTSVTIIIKTGTAIVWG